MKKTLCLILASMLGASAFGNLMMQIISTHNGPAVVINGITYYLPAYAVTEPTTNYPAGFASFDFEPTTTNVSVSAPQISEWTRQNQPGDTMALTAENLDTSSIFVFSDDGSEVLAGDILALDDRQCAVTLPDGLSYNAFYLMWPYNADGFGEPAPINQTEEWWVGPDVTWRGQTFSVFGQNLTLDGTSHVYIEGYGWLSATNCNPYKADFTVPLDMTNGTYVLHAHNGHGGKYGWDMASTGMTLTVRDAIEWSDETNTWFNVKSYGAVGDGVTDDTTAILFAVTAARVGSDYHTVYFPEGTYLISSAIYPNDDFLRYKGDGIDVSMLQGSSDSWSGSYGALIILKSKSSVEDMTVRMGDVAKTPVLVQGGTEYNKDNRLVRVKLSCLSPGPEQETDGAGALGISTSDRFRAEDSIFLTDYGIDMGTGSQFFFNNCEFITMGDCNGIASYSGDEMALVDCYAHPLDATDATDGSGWGKGRWIYGGGTINKVYIGGNVSSNMAPRLPGVEFSAASTNVTGGTAANTTNFFYFAEGTITGSIASIVMPADMIVESPDSDHIRGYHIVSVDTNTLVVGIKRDWYTGAFATNGVCSIREIVDQNSGEQFLWEAMNAYYRGAPTIVSNATTLVFDDLSGVKGATFAIVEGRGAGQMRKCSYSTSTGVVTLADPLRILPDTNSLCKIGKFLDRVVMYDNDLNGTDRAAVAGEYTATTGFNCFGGASRLIIDGNRFGKMKTGLELWANTDKSPCTIIQPNLFNVVKNNTIDTCQVGLSQTIQDWGRAVVKDPTLFGHVIRGNTIINSTVDALSESTSSGRMQKDLCVFDGNTIYSNEVFLGSSKSNIFNQVWINNTITGNGEDAFTASAANSYLVHSNTIAGFGAEFVGGFVVPYLQIPQGTILLSDASKTIELYNVGTTGLTWTATDNAAWLDVTSSGSIAAESVGQMTLTRVGSTTNGATALVSVVGGGATNTFTVIYGDELGTP